VSRSSSAISGRRTAANALWETFLKGEDLPVAIQAWTEAAQKLGHAVGPLLDFPRGIGS